MDAYAPISMKVFGSEALPVNYKLVFMRSLVLSTLTFNLHILVLKVADFKKASNVYMRVLRRTTNDPRYSKDTHFTDLQIRQQLEAPSIDCILMRVRLRYMSRLARHQPPTLTALLHVRLDDQRLPWIMLRGQN